MNNQLSRKVKPSSKKKADNNNSIHQDRDGSDGGKGRTAKMNLAFVSEGNHG